jgi:signal transduction histidine kinase
MLKKIFQALPDIFFRLFADGTILEYKAGVDFHPFPQDIIGKRIQDILPKEIALKLGQAIQDLQETKSIIRIEYPFTHQNFYEARLVPLLEDQIVVIIQNVTERKNAEKNLKKAKEEAEKANRTKSEFLARITHELRTPLNGILGYSQILKRDENLTESQLSGIYVIERSSNYLLNLINDLLDLSKIEAEKMELHESSVNFPKFLTDISEMVRIQAQKKGISFRYETTSELPQAIHIDEKPLSQVLLNLLSNAIKFTERGGVALKVGVIEPKSLVRFRISDSGVGIPPDKLDAIFSPYEQLGKHKHEGTGLGLAISQKLVRLMGGELHVDSTVNKGSSFWFDLDLSKEQATKQNSVDLPVTEGEQALSFPPNDDLRILYEYAKQGNCSGIARWLEQMTLKNTQSLPFIHEVSTLAQEFEHEKICKLIEGKNDKA